MFGLLNVYKPKGITSYDVIRHVRRRLGRKVKLGHAGTLDPLAEGVLVICLGPATRLVEVIQAYAKEYVAVAYLGASSSTDDAEGEIRPTPGAAAPSPEAVEQTLRRFVGTVEQVPPAHSAVKVGGQRAYELARRGEAPDLAPKRVTVHALEVLGYEYPRLRVRVRCGSGTYIRSLLRDAGEALGVGGYCLELVRTAVGPFRADQAIGMELLGSGPLEKLLIPPAEALRPEARVQVTTAQVEELALGRAVKAPRPLEATRRHELLGAIGPEGELIGLVRLDDSGQLLRPSRIFVRPRPER